MKKFLLPTIVVCSLLFASVAMGAYKYSGMTQEEKKALYTKLSIDTEKKLQEFEAIDKKGVVTQDKDIQLKAQKAGEDFKKRSIEQADIHNEIDAVDYDQRINEIIDAATLEIPNVNLAA